MLLESSQPNNTSHVAPHCKYKTGPQEIILTLQQNFMAHKKETWVLQSPHFILGLITTTCNNTYNCSYLECFMELQTIANGFFVQKFKAAIIVLHTTKYLQRFFISSDYGPQTYGPQTNRNLPVKFICLTGSKYDNFQTWQFGME